MTMNFTCLDWGKASLIIYCMVHGVWFSKSLVHIIVTSPSPVFLAVELDGLDLRRQNESTCLWTLHWTSQSRHGHSIFLVYNPKLLFVYNFKTFFSSLGDKKLELWQLLWFIKTHKLWNDSLYLIKTVCKFGYQKRKKKCT